MAWLSTIRVRVFAVVVGLGLAVMGMLAWTALPVLPVVGVAVVTVAAVLNGMTGRLAERACHHCGEPLGDSSAGAYGVICKSCGGINSQPSIRRA
ncbi:MAG: hypothetical protein AAF235_07740 [Planctomycetota bacterium]